MTGNNHVAPWLRFALLAVLIAAPVLGATAAHAVPVRAIAGLDSITFWERTGGVGPSPFIFGVNSSELTTRLLDPLGGGNNDITGTATEFYDVYYSNADGSFNLDGEYLTISGVFGQSLPAGGGLNLAEIGLNFVAAPAEFGNFLASFFVFGNNAAPTNVGNAIDGDLLTHTTMGNTIGAPERLRLTLGFLSSSGPPPMQDVASPGTAGLFLFGLMAALVGVRRRR